MRSIKLLIAFSVFVVFAQFLRAQTVESPAAISLQPFITTGLSSPVFMTGAHDGTGRLFIVQQGGIIKVVQPNMVTTNFLNITARVACCGERGLLGLAFHPQYKTNGRFFVYYTRISDAAIQIAEYHVSATSIDVADTTEKVIITIPHPINANHNGGTVAFGPDGYLYAGTGDGGDGNDPPNNSQNINVLLGKILRLDVNNVSAGQVPQYSIPPTNPYAGAIPGADEIYAIGMRNPYRFSFDLTRPQRVPGDTTRHRGNLWVADVGQGAIEEVDNNVKLGGNYGWRAYEGTNCTNLNPTQCAGGSAPIDHTPPLFQYGHTGGRCSIIGGYVYRNRRNTFPAGSYVFGDYCTGEIFLWTGGASFSLVIDAPHRIVAFARDDAGEIYSIGEGGPIEKLVVSGGRPTDIETRDADVVVRTKARPR